MANAFSITGKVINVGDRVTAIGVITAVSSPINENSTVTVQTPLAASTVTVNAIDMQTEEGTAEGPALGNQVTVGNDATIMGLVTAISGTGNTANLTVTGARSGASITLVSGACYSDNV